MHTNSSGEYSSERQKLHRKIVSELLANGVKYDNPTFTIMGGGPAAGKSNIIKNGSVEFRKGTIEIDSDSIKSRLPEYQQMVKNGDIRAAMFSHEESSHIAKLAMKSAAAKGYDYVLDGTGDGSLGSLKAKSDHARASGYKVVGEYVTVNTEVAVSRARVRGEKTGRVVPDSVIRETHSRVSTILPKAVQEGVFDSVRLWDTNNGTRLIFSHNNGKSTIVDGDAYQSFLGK